METNKSTGPTTLAGKEISSRNAVTHGLYSSRIEVPACYQDDFTEMHTRYSVALLSANPSAAELIFFEAVFKDAFTTFRIENYLSFSYDDRPEDPLMNLSTEKLHAFLVRSKASFHRNLKLLQAHQTSRFLAKCLPYPMDENTVPPLANPKPVIDIAKRTGKGFAVVAMNTLVDTVSKEEKAADRGKRTPEVTTRT